MANQITHLALIGFGEAAGAFVEGFADHRPERVTAYDIKLHDADASSLLQARAIGLGVELCEDVATAVAGADAVFCLVTADQAIEAARSATLTSDAFWFDGNSCSPGTKQLAAEEILGAGGRYVDMAIMAPVYPKRHLTPILLSGPDAEMAAHFLRLFDMQPRVVGDTVGRASSIKMLRSVMIKGMEALFAECLLSARRAGVEDDVLASLIASNPEIPWVERAAYNLERMMVHGTRRAAEMREVARTVEELGLGGEMSLAASIWQDRIADCQLSAGADQFVTRADRLLTTL